MPDCDFSGSSSGVVTGHPRRRRTSPAPLEQAAADSGQPRPSGLEIGVRAQPPLPAGRAALQSTPTTSRFPSGHPRAPSVATRASCGLPGLVRDEAEPSWPPRITAAHCGAHRLPLGLRHRIVAGPTSSGCRRATGKLEPEKEWRDLISTAAPPDASPHKPAGSPNPTDQPHPPLAGPPAVRQPVVNPSFLGSGNAILCSSTEFRGSGHLSCDLISLLNFGK
ncbi:nascent polypeptide-associated complex subunit alpha, muscle-specific form-like [Ananas comosus]|uniref:Nascent polypeptide-associated complex subunit alpha, muscle-specific form-like n=1 Tax=Ananas comosus TaxID=4615 RepID=A0A6P5G9N2_ANACO|nr:nascent polypeptide-associated complex subunit alpha, muscle-specific form-like [Ananas comosus]